MKKALRVALLSVVVFFGNLLGKIIHDIKGCEGFYSVKVGPKGKVKSRTCKRCKKRWDRMNGKWCYMGYYK